MRPPRSFLARSMIKDLCQPLRRIAPRPADGDNAIATSDAKWRGIGVVRIHSAIILGLMVLAPAADAQAPAIPDVDRVRIAEAFRLADARGDRVWPGWG